MVFEVYYEVFSRIKFMYLLSFLFCKVVIWLFGNRFIYIEFVYFNGVRFKGIFV